MIKALSILMLILVSCCVSVNVNKIENFYKFKKNTSMKSKSITLDNSDMMSDDNKELTTVEKIEDSPFNIVKIDDKYFLALGKYRLTEPLDDRKSVLADVDNVSWHRILSVMNIVAMEVYDEQNKRAVEGLNAWSKSNSDNSKLNSLKKD